MEDLRAGKVGVHHLYGEEGLSLLPRDPSIDLDQVNEERLLWFVQHAELGKS